MRARAVLVTMGVLVMGFAVAGLLTDPDVAPDGVLLFLAGVLAGHDVVWMAVVLIAGAVLARLGPRRRALVRAAAISAATVTVVAVPLVLGFGRPADDPSALPLPYGRNLAVVLAGVATVTVLACLVPARPAAGSKKSERPGPGGP